MIGVYSLLLVVVLVLGAPYWFLRMITSGRYRAGLAGRLGRVPNHVTEAGNFAQAQGRRLVWVHAVSVGEVLAATSMIRALQEAGLVVAISTTTQAGQELAKGRFAECAVFYMPLDLGVLVRRYFKALQPRLMVTMESELWPNVIRQCVRAGIPLAVVNARVSDRSFPKYMRLKAVWAPLLREVTMFLAQSEETAQRLRQMGVAPARVKLTGNLKFDVKSPRTNRMSQLLQEMAEGRQILVAGSTLGGKKDDALSEDEMVIQAWEGTLRAQGVMLVLAPRHTDRFDEVYSVAIEFPTLRATKLLEGKEASNGFSVQLRKNETARVEIIVLDTIGDLASVYSIATVAFVGGSLVPRGGHNPLEPAQFGVPVVMGESYVNFKEIVGAMKDAAAIRIVDREHLSDTLIDLLRARDAATAMGQRGRSVYEAQSGATERTVGILLMLAGVTP